MHTVTLEILHVISDHRARIDMIFVHRALESAYWAEGRAPALTERSFARSLPFGVYAPAGAQVGMARLITDYTFRAHLADVFIDPTARGLGLGRALIETILGHPELATVRTWTLRTRDAHGLYRRFGFVQTTADEADMTLKRVQATA